MILDIIVLVLMVIPAAIGIYRGFLRSFVRATSWIIALACGFFLKDTAAGFLEKSSYGEIKAEIAGKPVTNMAATFMGCGNMVVAPAIPKTVTSLSATFCACASLQTASLPTTVTYIGENGFSYCSSLKDIYYAGTETQWKSIKNYNVDSSIKKATIHYNSLNQ